jgi:predicted PhzF superfamily epimerase YddE/YHI9
MNYLVVDAFSSKPFGGNPAAVVPLESPLDDRTLQAIAGGGGVPAAFGRWAF